MASNMWTKAFWLDTAERAIKTFAQTTVAFIGANAIGVLDVVWLDVASVSGLAAFLSMMTSLASAPFSTKGTASMTGGIEYNA